MRHDRGDDLFAFPAAEKLLRNEESEMPLQMEMEVVAVGFLMSS